MSAELKKDRKSETWIITRTDEEGFHRQIQLTTEEMWDVILQFKMKYNKRDNDKERT